MRWAMAAASFILLPGIPGAIASLPILPRWPCRGNGDRVLLQERKRPVDGAGRVDPCFLHEIWSYERLPKEKEDGFIEIH